MTSFEHEALIFCTIVCGLMVFLMVVVAAMVFLVPTEVKDPAKRQGMF